ncbi:MAG: Holliday junction resolvase RuvX [Muribaculaceae bacterium]|nr:Holliday junction resolvase RuvX [Muribaculaceae bacterium]
MGRVIAIDYGRKRCGIAVTDPLQISANGLPTQRACDLMGWLQEYCGREDVERIVVGLPKTLRGEPSESARYIEPFLKHLARVLPDMTVERFDERFTSTIAHREMIAGGVKRSARQQKDLADKTAAVIILTDWLNSRQRMGVNFDNQL